MDMLTLQQHLCYKGFCNNTSAAEIRGKKWFRKGTGEKSLCNKVVVAENQAQQSRCCRYQEEKKICNNIVVAERQAQQHHCCGDRRKKKGKIATSSLLRRDKRNIKLVTRSDSYLCLHPMVRETADPFRLSTGRRVALAKKLATHVVLD